MLIARSRRRGWLRVLPAIGVGVAVLNYIHPLYKPSAGPSSLTTPRWTETLPVNSKAERDALDLVYSISAFDAYQPPSLDLINSSTDLLTTAEEHKAVWKELLPTPTDAAKLKAKMVKRPPSERGVAEKIGQAIRESRHLTMVAIASRESRYVVEWLTWHRLCGVQRFILVDVVPGGDPGGENGEGGAQGETLRELLRPWLIEGSVILIEASWKGAVPQMWHHIFLAYVDRYITPRTSWLAQWDMDEFFIPPTTALLDPSYSTIPYRTRPGWSDLDSPSPPVDHAGSQWFFPTYARLAALDPAGCVPIWRLYYHVNIKDDIDPLKESVIGVNIIRDKISERGGPAVKNFGKVILHPNFKSKVARFKGMHGCDAASILSPYTGEDLEPYEEQGVAWEGKGMTISHYVNRSVRNCLSKLEVLKDLKFKNWRQGHQGSGASWCTPKDPTETTWLAEDRTLADSWEGRMTEAILKNWRGPTGWTWLEGNGSYVGKGSDSIGVVRIQLSYDPKQ